jgi:hypothetical protein
MHQFTNMPAPEPPDTPLRTRLARLTRPRLTAIAILWATHEETALPVGYSVLHLPCARSERTPQMTLDPASLEVTFRTVIADTQDLADVTRAITLFTRDKTRAHIRAALLASYTLHDDLAAIAQIVKTAPEIASEVTAQTPPGHPDHPRRQARLVNLAGDQQPSPADWRRLCKIWDVELDRLDFTTRELADHPIITGHVTEDPRRLTTSQLVTAVTSRALATALITSRLHGRCTWDGVADVAAALSPYRDSLAAAQEAPEAPET